MAQGGVSARASSRRCRDFAVSGDAGGEPVVALHRPSQPWLGTRSQDTAAWDYSHSIVAGGFEERSSATRLTPGSSLMMREEIVSSRS